MTDQQIEACARAAHEANRAYCLSVVRAVASAFGDA